MHYRTVEERGVGPFCWLSVTNTVFSTSILTVMVYNQYNCLS